MDLIITLAFCRPQHLRAAILRAKEQTENYHEFKHVVFDCCYPVPDEMENALEVKKICSELGCDLVILPENMGIVGNYGETARYTRRLYPEARYLLYYDPDSNPLQRDWAKSIINVMEEKGCAYVSLSRPVADAVQNSDNETIGNNVAKRITTPCGWPMGAYRASFLWNIDSWEHDNPYGYGENFMFAHFTKQNTCGYMLMDTVDNGFEFLQADFDHNYIVWKIECAHHKTKLGFSQWLKERNL